MKKCVHRAFGQQQEPVDMTPEEEAVHLASLVPTPEQVRGEEFDSAIRGDSQIAALKAMTNAEYSAWFDANVTNNAQAIGLLKRVVRVLIRRVL